MSQLQTVLRRSVAHLDPSDHDGRERMFSNAREAMIRLLWSYDPPLTPSEIDSKIDEFDGVVADILQEGEIQEGEVRETEIPETEIPDAELQEAELQEAEPPETEPADDETPSSLVTPEPGILDRPEALPFSTALALALPPRQPVRKLARFEPLSQIGTPTPARGGARDADRPMIDPDLVAALSALDAAAPSGDWKSPRSTARPESPAEPLDWKDDTRPDDEAAPADRDETDAQEDDAQEDEGTAPLDLDHDDFPEMDASRDYDLRDEDEPSSDEAVDPDAEEDPSLEPEDEEEPEDEDEDEPGPEDDVESEPVPARESAEDILRRHRERFDASDPDESGSDLDDGREADRKREAEPEPGIDEEPEPFDRDEPDDAPFDEDEPRPTLVQRLRDAAGGVSAGMTGVIAGIVLLVVLGLGGGAFLLLRSSPPTATTVTEAAAPAPPTDIAGVIAAAPQEEPPQEAAAPPPPAEPAPGALALETLNLFDGRDPSVFQSLPDNPVRFEGDTQGGFARVASSIHSTGSRIRVGRGVYERLAGRTIRIVVVARAAATSPAHTLRFAYQNGRSLSPWQDGDLGKDYAPLSATWTVPKERGGPETDAILIEPGIPGDGTAADIKSVRVEVLK